MNYFYIRMMSGDIWKITQEEFQKLAGKTGLWTIPSCGVTVNLSSVESISPEELYLKQTKNKITEGRLHDGTKVIKRFNEWVMLSNPTVRLDYSYYPELRKDTVLSEEEWQAKKSKQLKDGEHSKRIN